jgi:hypothetical protein
MMTNPFDNQSFAELDQWGDEARPEYAFRPGLDTVNPGDYDFEIVDAKMDRIKNMPVIRVGLRLLNAGGRQVEQVYWLNAQAGVNAFLADMAALSFPAAKWGNGQGQVQLSVAIPELMPKLVGVKFRAMKATEQGSDTSKKPFHKLYINGRISGTPMPTLPGAPGGMHANAPVTQLANARSGASTPRLPQAAPADEIPF